MRLVVLLLVTLLHGACRSPLQSRPLLGSLGEPGRSYTAPATYRQHRTQQRTFQTPAGAIAYTDHGAGDAIVLLHGVPTSSWMYRKVIPKLQVRHRVISVDLLGYGSSAKPEDASGTYSAASQANRVRALLDSIGVQRYSVMMHDMGGLVAWEIMRQDISAVENLIVLNTIVREKGFEHPGLDPGMMTKTITKAYSNRWTSSIILERSFAFLGLNSEKKLSERECEGYVKPLREGSDAALYAFFTSIDDYLFAKLESNRHLFARFRGRTLVLWGAKDKSLTTDQIPFLHQHLRIPASDIHVYTDNAHFLAEEIPEEIATQVLRFTSRS